MAKKTVLDLNVEGKKVLVRVDFNVPLKDGAVTDDNRITAALPTINYLCDNGAKVILFSHLGKVPHKDAEETEKAKKKNNMAPVAARLAELVDRKVTFVPATRGEELETAIASMQNGEIVVMQNTRYEKGEEKNDPELAQYWAGLADLYVSDAFGSVHRAHASTVGVAKYLESACGFLIEKELKFLGDAVENPVRPFVGILGGAKIGDKLKVINNLLEKCDTLIIGGGMAYTFFKAQGREIGESLVDMDQVDYCREMLEKAEKLGKKLLLPVDTVVADSFPDPIDSTAITTKVVKDIPADMQGLDIGPETAALFAEEVRNAKTVVWNGPMGVFENPILAQGTTAVAQALAECTGTTVIGGGDSAAAINSLGLADKVSHVSTGGGASLEFLEGNGLPGVDAIEEKKTRKKIIVGNWKMNKTIAEAVEFIEGIEPVVHNDADFGIATSFLALQESIKRASKLIVAAENCHFEESGAFTGEVSIPMLQEIGLKWCIIGHSERRQMFGETDEALNKKVKKLFAAGITPILCCGESLETFEAGQTEEWVRGQIKADLDGVNAEDVANMVIAYEPIWAIGTGKSATKEIAQDTCALVRDQIRQMFGEETAQKVRIQYGGSVKPENIAEYMACPDIDGALIGGASLKVDSFTAIINAVH